jgi:hypothetical protein
MRKIARYIYVGLAWTEFVVLFIPVFVAGMALFVRNSYWSDHSGIGWLSGWPLLLLIIAGLVSWIPRRLTAWLVGMILLHTFHTALPGFQADIPMLSAVHPVSAVLLIWVTLIHARKANQLLLEPYRGSGITEQPAQVEPNA